MLSTILEKLFVGFFTSIVIIWQGVLVLFSVALNIPIYIIVLPLVVASFVSNLFMRKA